MQAYAYAHSYLRSSSSYNNQKVNNSEAIGSTNEWRIWLDIPVKLF